MNKKGFKRFKKGQIYILDKVDDEITYIFMFMFRKVKRRWADGVIEVYDSGFIRSYKKYGKLYVDVVYLESDNTICITPFYTVVKANEKEKEFFEREIIIKKLSEWIY